MKVYTEVVISMVTGEVLKEEWFEYDGPVALCKGDSTAKSITQQQNQREQEAWDLQKQTLGMLQQSFGHYLTNPEGFSPSDLAAMQSGALNDNALAYSQAGNTIRDQVNAMGGSGDLPVSGNTISRLSGLAGMGAAQKADTLNSIRTMNAQQKLANQFNAGSLMSGNAATLGGSIGAFTSGTSSALNSYIQSKNQGFGASFMNSLGGGLGKGFAGIATGGISGMLGSVPGVGRYV